MSSPGQSSPRSMQRGESTGLGLEESSQCSDIDNLDDAEMDDEIEAFERSLKTDWEVNITRLPHHVTFQLCSSPHLSFWVIDGTRSRA
jgi:hypothetical protein